MHGLTRGGAPQAPRGLGVERGFPEEGAVPPPHNFWTLDLKMLTYSAFWALFVEVQLPIVQPGNTAFELTKLAAAACMQCTAQRKQNAANTSLLESRSLLQTPTLVFPQPIVCSRVINIINILAKKIARPPTGVGAWPPGPGLDPPLLLRWVVLLYLCCVFTEVCGVLSALFGCQHQWNTVSGTVRLRNNLLCVQCDVKPYTLNNSHQHCISDSIPDISCATYVIYMYDSSS